MNISALMDHQYLNQSILGFLERERMARQIEQQEAELTRQLATQEHIYSYPDGSVYMGHMRENDAEIIKNGGLSHLRHGRGTLRTPAFVCGIPWKNYTSDEAAENAQFAKWYEYAGTWENDKMNGYGVNVQKSGDGGEIIIFDGIWKHGKPIKSVHFKEEGDNDENESDE
jgi:hypothetical protein